MRMNFGVQASIQRQLNTGQRVNGVPVNSAVQRQFLRASSTEQASSTNNISSLLPNDEDNIDDIVSISIQAIEEENEDANLDNDELEETQEERSEEQFGFVGIESGREIDQNSDTGANFEDNSAAFTRRLRAAESIFPIQTLLKDVGKDISELRKALIGASKEDAEKIREIIRRLDRVMLRGNRKIRDLGHEEQMQRNIQRAEELEQQQRAREIERELERHIRRRRKRENEWVRTAEEDAANCRAGEPNFPGMLSGIDAATRAQIAAQAQAMAAAQMAAQASMGAVAGTSGASSGEMSSGGSGGDFGSSGGEAQVSGGSINAMV